MKIATTNKVIINKLGDNDITYFFNEKDNIDELIELSKICNVKKTDNQLFDIAVDCENVNAIRYHTSKDKISNILKPIEKKDYKFSIIIPNCNYGEWLKKSIGSVLNQTYKNYEIIFIDDISSDDSVKIAKSLLRKEDKLIELKSKRLNGGTRNEGLIYARDNSDSDYIVFLDSDDWLINNKVLEKFNKRLYGQDVMFCGVQRWKNNENEKLWYKPYKNKYEAMTSGHSGACFKVIKRELVTRPECFFNEGTLMEDRNHHCRICYYMKSFIMFGEASHIWNRDNTKSVCSVRDKVLWGTSLYRNYADCKQFLLEITPDGDNKAIGILENRLYEIERDIKNNADNQH